MNKSFRRIGINRPMTNGYTQRNPGSFAHKKNNIYRKVAKQILICIMIVTLVILVKSVNTSITNKTTEIIKTSLTKEMDFKKSMSGVVKYVQDIPNIPHRVASVFSSFGKQKIEGLTFIAPMEGEIISSYGENIDPILSSRTFQTGIDILGSGTQDVVSVADGEVVELGASNKYGNFIKIQHKDNVVSLYGNCGEVFVSKGAKVRKGMKVAKVINDSNSDNNNTLHFELWIDGDVVDPANYMSFDTMTL